MQAVSTFTDMVTELVKIDQTKFAEAGTTIADAFKYFIDNLWGAFKDAEYTDTIEHTLKADEVRHGNRMVDIINGLQNIGTIIEAVDSFVDLIAKTIENKKKYGDLGAHGKSLAIMLNNFVF